MRFVDRILAAEPRKTADGYLVAQAKVARTGIQLYRGDEVGRPELEVVRVYRPETEVFSRDSIQSFAHRPMTNDHPSEPVTADNWKQTAVGNTGGDVVRDGEFVRVPLVLMDAAAIRDFEAGKRELSMGYDAEIVFEDGKTPSGEPYDAVQRSLRMNHLALVDAARGGNELRIGDRRDPAAEDPAANPPNQGGQDMADKTRTVIVDGLSIETTEQGAQALEKLQKQLGDAQTALSTATTDHATALAKKDAEIDDLKGKVLTDAQLDARVQARADLITKAKAISDQDYSGKPDAEIRKAAVVAKLGDAAVAGKEQAYIDARFDILVESVKDASPDPFAAAMAARDAGTQVADNGYAESVRSLQMGPDYAPSNGGAQ